MRIQGYIMPETLEQSSAFDYYFSLGKDRTLDQVAHKFKKALPTIKKWSSLYSWKERVEQRDIDLSKRLMEKTDTTILNTKANYRKQIKRAISKIAPDDSFDIDVESVQDYERLVKLDLLLMGEDTESQKIKVEGGPELLDELKRRYDRIAESRKAGSVPIEPDANGKS